MYHHMMLMGRDKVHESQSTQGDEEDEVEIGPM